MKTNYKKGFLPVAAMVVVGLALVAGGVASYSSMDDSASAKVASEMNATSSVAVSADNTNDTGKNSIRKAIDKLLGRDDASVESDAAVSGSVDGDADTRGDGTMEDDSNMD